MKTATSPQPANGNGQSRALTPIEQVGQQLDFMTDKLRSALPAHIPVDRFKRVVLTAINLNPDLLNADRRSLFNSASKAASDGLVPDGREGALVIFKDWKTQKEMVQWMPMVAGLLKLIRQSNEISAISARCVYEEEVKQGRFSFRIEDGVEKLTHDPILFGSRGKLVGVYATAKFKDGTVQNEPLTAEDVAKIRAVSKTGKSERGPWAQWEDEMWRKSALRRLRKYLPTSAEDQRLAGALDRDFVAAEIDQIRETERQPQSITHAAASLAAPTGQDTVDTDAVVQEAEIVHGGEPGEQQILTLELHPREGGGNDYARFHKEALAMIETLDPSTVPTWLDLHAEKVAATGKAKKAWADEIGAAAKTRIGAAD